MSGKRNINGVPVKNVTGSHRACYSIDCGCLKQTGNFMQLSRHLQTCESATAITYHPPYGADQVVLRKDDL